MIKLKNILITKPKRRLTEQRGNEQQKKLNVLFIGDEETSIDSSYAKKILNSGLITGEIVAKRNKDITTAKLRNLVISNISDAYDVVCIMDNALDDAEISVDQSISNLNDAYTEAKKFNAKLIVIANAEGRVDETEQTQIINKWITTVQTITDDIIDIKNTISNISYDKNGILMPEVQSRIAKDVISILIGYIKNAEVRPGAESDENDYLWILSDLQSKVDAKTVFRSIGYGDVNNLGWLGTEEAWQEAKNSYAVVHKIQLQLSKLKYVLGARGTTGDYNKDTERAVRSFQEKNDLPTTGLLDLRTVALLFDKDAKAADYVKDVKKSASAMQIDVDAEWMAITDKIIDNFEGGYWNNDKTQPADKICSNHPYAAMYANSGETLFGLDRRAGGIDKIKPYGEQFFGIIDAEKTKLGSNFCNVWVYNYRGGDKESELKKLASKVMYDLYQDYAKRYLSNEARRIVESNKRLLFHFAYASWNGPGFFSDFGKVVNQGVAQGNGVEELIELSIAARNRRFGGTDWATANSKVIDIIKNDPELE
jgi:peptidoglycan hydrolase-like protein with peptidoglycan-binding domain